MEQKERGSGAVGHIEVLDRDACLALLSSVVIGRVVWSPYGKDLKVVPVNFVLDGDGIVFRTAHGGKLDAIQHGVSLVFETDDVEAALRVGWSVVLSGRAEVVTDREQVGRLERLVGAPWAAMIEPVFVRVSVQEISGRRIPLHAGGVVVQPVEDA